MRSMASMLSWTVARGDMVEDSVSAIAAVVLLLGVVGGKATWWCFVGVDFRWPVARWTRAMSVGTECGEELLVGRMERLGVFSAG